MHPIRGIEYGDYRIGLAPTRLLRLRDLNIQIPNAIYYPYAESYIRGDNTRVGDGSPKIEWIFDLTSLTELESINSLIFPSDSVSYAEGVYIRSDKRTLGSYPNPKVSFATFSCTAYRPEVGTEGTPLARGIYGIQTVKYTFTNLLEE